MIEDNTMESDVIEESLCLHRIDSYCWMDERCFLMLAKYLERYYHGESKLKDISYNQILLAALSFETLFACRKLFTIKSFGERLLLLSFAYPESFSIEPGRTMDFEFFYQKDGCTHSAMVSFFL